jgi:hypothetical protein
MSDQSIDVWACAQRLYEMLILHAMHGGKCSVCIVVRKVDVQLVEVAK